METAAFGCPTRAQPGSPVNRRIRTKSVLVTWSDLTWNDLTWNDLTWKDPEYRALQFLRMKSKRPRPALISHLPPSINQVKSIRPPGVRTLSGVSKFIQHRGDFDSQLAHAGSGNERAFFFTAGTGKHNFFFYVALHLPHVAGVRFGNVDHQKCDPVPELLVEFVEGRNLPPEGRSCIASKHQHHRAILRGQRGQLQPISLVEFGQREIRGRTSHLQCTRSGPHPKRFKGKNEKWNRSRDPGHYASKAFWRLPHHAIQRSARQHPQSADHAQSRDHSIFDRLGSCVHANPKTKCADY